MQTAEGELELEIPQLREAAEPFTSKLFPRETKRLLTSEPLKALVVGAFVRGLSMRDVESGRSLADGGEDAAARPRLRGAPRPNHTARRPCARRPSA